MNVLVRVGAESYCQAMQITHEVREHFDKFIAHDGTRPSDYHLAAVCEVLDRLPDPDDATYVTGSNNGGEVFVATKRGIFNVYGGDQSHIRFASWAQVSELQIEPLDPVSTGNREEPDYIFTYKFHFDGGAFGVSARASDFVRRARHYWRESGNPNAF